MRKKLAVLIAVITAAMMLFGCGGKDMSGSEYLGKWKATKAEYAGIEVGVDTVFDEFHFTLQDNGKVKLNVNGDETTGKWDETENGISIEDTMQSGYEPGDREIKNIRSMNIIMWTEPAALNLNMFQQIVQEKWTMHLWKQSNHMILKMLCHFRHRILPDMWQTDMM